MAKRYKRADQYTVESTRMTENGPEKTGKKNTYIWIGKQVLRNPKARLAAKKRSSGGAGG